MQRLARIQPVGMTPALAVAEVMPWTDRARRSMLEQVADRHYETALEAFEQGRWDEARSLLEPLTDNGPASFLLQLHARHPGRTAAGVERRHCAGQQVAKHIQSRRIRPCAFEPCGW